MQIRRDGIFIPSDKRTKYYSESKETFNYYLYDTFFKNYLI
ncbi:hypothetical protein M104_0876 [Bacteroides fragilis str. 1007-1-F |uniref:Uncharacterized protein n=2 Tax=Bacteroides fragilis TaxID=817 RepID=A0A015V9P5_BACFG|nr:hypothetical protein M101_0703 [Bacteroides fragilis str. 1007-1-F \